VSAGDPSGDRLGAALLHALRARGARFDAAGLGGPALRAAGLDAHVPMESVAIMGFADIVRHLPAIRRARSALVRLLRETREALFLPIDSPGMNLGLARAAHRIGRPVIYYVCPQIWAWGYGRVRRLREDVDLTLCLFRFEEEILTRERIRHRWVGHPAGGLSPDPSSRESARAAIGLDPGETLLAILPGSRRAEARRHLAPMLEAASLLRASTRGKLRVAVSDAAMPRLDGHALKLWRGLEPIHHRGDAEALLRAADLAVVASGTATLETAALGVPMVIVYRTSGINYGIARRLVRLRRIGLANIVAGGDIAPERIQAAATGPSIAAALAPLLETPAERDRQRAGFASLGERLGGSGSAERAADAILAFVGERRAAPVSVAAR